MKIAIQAHSFSKRLPEKIYQKIGERSILEWCVASCHEVWPDIWIIGTSKDQQLIDFCAEKNLPLWVASGVDDADVLGRYAKFARTTGDTIMRVTSDCPFISAPALSYCISNSRHFDFTSNIFPPRNLLDGDDIEICSPELLIYLDKRVTLMEHREHVFPYVYDNAEVLAKDFKICKIRQLLNFSDIKTSIDTPEDLEAVRKRYRDK